MDMRKFAMGTAATFVVGFALSMVWHTMLMAGAYEAAGEMRDPPLFWAVITGYLIVALIMAYMYPKGYEGGSPVSEGFKFGAMIGIVWWLASQLVLYGATESAFTLVYVDGGWHIFEQGLAGIALASAHGRGSDKGTT